MPSQNTFMKTQDRTFFNQNRPILRNFDESFVGMNKRGPLMPVEEVNRQTGSGRFAISPVHEKFEGMGKPGYSPLARNNWDPTAKSYISIVPGSISSLARHGTIHSTIGQLSIQQGGAKVGLPPYRNPAENNWRPGTRIPELQVNAKSDALRLHSFRQDPQWNHQPRVDSRQRILSTDDGKPFSETKKYTGTFHRPEKNPFIRKALV